MRLFVHSGILITTQRERRTRQVSPLGCPHQRTVTIRHYLSVPLLLAPSITQKTSFPQVLPVGNVKTLYALQPLFLNLT